MTSVPSWGVLCSTCGKDYAEHYGLCHCNTIKGKGHEHLVPYVLTLGHTPTSEPEEQA